MIQSNPNIIERLNLSKKIRIHSYLEYFGGLLDEFTNLKKTGDVI